MIFNSVNFQRFTSPLKRFALGGGFVAIGAEVGQSKKVQEALKDTGVKIIDVSKTAVKTILKPFEIIGSQTITILLLGVIGLILISRILGRIK